MRSLTLLVAGALATTAAAPASARDLLGQLALTAAQSAVQGLAKRATSQPAKPRAATPAAPSPARADTPAAATAESRPEDAVSPAASSADTLVIRNKMAVISSDGVRVAETMHVPGEQRAYGPGEMFFTADTTYRLRRIYAREVTVRGAAVHLKMTAAQYRARNQNPEFYPG